jgi:HAD superfamily phosphoserine phosphatase-like hydrolase
MAKPTHVVTKDFDGTCTGAGCATLKYAERMTLDPGGVAALETMRIKYKRLAERNEMTPAQAMHWLVETLDVYVAQRPSLKVVRQAVAAMPLRDGVRDCLEMLSARGIPVAIVSYGIAAFIRMYLEHHGLARFVQRVYATEIHEDGGRMVGYDPSTFVVPENKGCWSRRFADEHGVPYGRILAVGDSPGDRNLGHLKRNRFGLADTASAEHLAPHFGRVVVTDTFHPAAAWLERKTRTP